MMSEPLAASESSAASVMPIPWWKRLWVVTLYFAEGFPYSVVRLVSTVFFKDSGASLQAIGLTSLYGLPWTLKFLWSPFVDQFATKRRWLLAAELALAVATAVMALGAATPRALDIVAGLFLLTALLSATHDIAIDGFYLEALDRKEQARFVGFQAMSYRLAMVAGGGGIVTLSGYTNWTTAFGVAAVVLLLLWLIHSRCLPRAEQPRRSMAELGLLVHRAAVQRTVAGVLLAILAVLGMGRLGWLDAPAAGFQAVLDRLGSAGLVSLVLLLTMLGLALNLKRFKRRLYASDSFYALAFVDYLDQPKVGLILTAIVLWRAGESFLLNMAYPFLSDAGVTRAQYGLIYGTFGIVASIIGGLLAGGLIARFGLRRMIWPCALSQNLLNLLYMFMAWHYVPQCTNRWQLSLALASDLYQAPFVWARQLTAMALSPAVWFPDLNLVAALIILEAFGAGMGTAAFMVFIMRTCKPSYKAAHMAIATSIMTVGATSAGIFSGILAGWLGYPIFFGFTFLATVPSMGLLLFLPYLDGSSAADLAGKRPEKR